MELNNLKTEHGVIRLKDVLELTSISKSSWWRGIQEGKYPKPVKLGEKTSVWYVRDIIDLLENLEEAC